VAEVNRSEKWDGTHFSARKCTSILDRVPCGHEHLVPRIECDYELAANMIRTS